jgi:hypothetical protein
VQGGVERQVQEGGEVTDFISDLFRLAGKEERRMVKCHACGAMFDTQTGIVRRMSDGTVFLAYCGRCCNRNKQGEGAK